MTKRKVICLTPIKNEAWILEFFLQSASTWADHIIIADQNSTDESEQIAKRYSKVVYIKNNSSEFNELDRQKLLIKHARKIGKNNILIALDADEILSGNVIQSDEWKTMLSADVGTILKFQWVNILPKGENCWIPKNYFTFGVIDDGSEHHGNKIHSVRVPIARNNKEMKFEQIKCLHYQYYDWARMKSKHRWYMAWEVLENNRTSITSIYRQYHHMYSYIENNILPVDDNWFISTSLGRFDHTLIKLEKSFFWDKEVLNYFHLYGLDKFSRIAIWDIDWSSVAKEHNFTSVESIHDPRDKMLKLFHQWLSYTQNSKFPTARKALDHLFKFIGL